MGDIVNDSVFHLFYSLLLGTILGIMGNFFVTSLFRYLDAKSSDNIPKKDKIQREHDVFIISIFMLLFVFILIVLSVLLYLDYICFYLFIGILFIVALIFYFVIELRIMSFRLPKWDYFQCVVLFFLVCMIALLHLILHGVTIP
jgi:uncharacterized membrane protein